MRDASAGPFRVDVRLIKQRTAPEDKDYRVAIGFRPSMVEVFAISDDGRGTEVLVAWDGQERASGVAHGGVALRSGAGSGLIGASIGVVIEDNGYVLGQYRMIKQANADLLVRASGTGLPVADLDEANAVELLRKDGGFGSGRMFEYDTSPPLYDWIGPTT